ncbi:Transcription factor MYB88 [Cardamine amara subsp. amara]|uniref:Transcription factor MYB88 n=1 Tax=Cardamine amara subsp. amara TaxID=228776 RepID=A0ABD1BN60_CARAN
MEETTKQTKKKTKIVVTNDHSKKKERHIVTWTPQEDDILRKQISLNGTENWAIIASKFTDKSTRQCRRRWYTYLNSDFKRGGWSPEEDTLLCEAQRLFGNRWTEIAKVVSGRTDNAVKNRFTTLCKKRAKYEAMAKENKITSCVNSNNKRLLFPDGISTPRKAESESPLAKKMRRSHIPNITEITSYGDRSHLKVDSGMNQQRQPPFSVVAHNATGRDSTEEQIQAGNVKESDGEDKSNQEVFLKKDDPKVTALMQQSELLSSLAQKVNADSTEQSIENAWKVLQDFLNKSKENDLFRYGIPDIDFQLEEFKDLVEDLRSSTEDSQASWRQPDLHDSPASSEYSSGSTVMQHPSADKTQQPMSDTQTTSPKENGKELVHEKGIVADATVEQVELLSTFHDVLKNSNGTVPMPCDEEFNSPVQVTPLFRSLAAGIPSPQFSESERNFLLKTLGVESPSPYPSANPSQPPPCKRVLLDSL